MLNSVKEWERYGIEKCSVIGYVFDDEQIYPTWLGGLESLVLVFNSSRNKNQSGLIFRTGSVFWTWKWVPGFILCVEQKLQSGIH
jgi:hypothetical protein